jgi:hypothetical protein
MALPPRFLFLNCPPAGRGFAWKPARSAGGFASEPTPIVEPSLGQSYGLSSILLALATQARRSAANTATGHKRTMHYFSFYRNNH